ncbi:hypothetical protein EV207_1105 [Scopulibacillus darangshiensis]|uniref:Uncharacterized protein n=1 Tax=Scopulibacillus darangshiensis TaxID=442528 RepID=A0A4R2P6G6_9BACL|nr:hypothetical protein [Scopulibacillus darangshiensis]TCP29385.1 hypothetical protein EV207_1105 [Scopulibacillus darangshiensis]
MNRIDVIRKEEKTYHDYCYDAITFVVQKKYQCLNFGGRML